MSSTERHRLVGELFDAVCELPPADREARLRALCQDEEVLSEVRSMLAYDGADFPLGASEAGRAVEVLARELLGDVDHHAQPKQIGSYRILDRLGEGGMGVIYTAWQESPPRRVALKVIRPGMVRPDRVRRFGREAQVLGRLQHPGIAQIYESGVSDLPGQPPFLVMELVEGLALLRHAFEYGLDVAQRLELIARVADAVHHAHQKGVIHRDLKPSNVLVVGAATSRARSTASTAAVDTIGQPKVLDFGIARLTDDTEVPLTMQTEAGQLLGTLAYMSPEQVAGAPLDIRVDVYALGVLLFEILTGVLPHRVSDVPLAEAARRIQQEEPPRLGEVDRRFRGDLETIVATAMARDRERRYGSAAELAADLRRHLHDLPIEARPQSATYRLVKFTRRHRGLVAGASLAVGALIVALALTATSLRTARVDRDRAREAQARVQRVADYQAAILKQIDVGQLGRELRAELDREFAPARETLLGRGELSESAYDTLLAQVNATNLARHALDASLLDQAVQTASRELENDPLTHAQILDALAEAYNNLGLPEPALALCQRCLDLRQASLAPDDPLIARSFGNVGEALLTMKRAEEARPYCAEALRRREAEEGGDPFLLLEARLRMAKVARRTGDLTQAEDLLRQTIASYDRLDPDDVLRLTAMNLLADVLMKTDRADQALALFEETLASRRRVLGDHDPETLATLNNIALALGHLGRDADAVTHYRELLPLIEGAVGDDDLRTLLVLENLAKAQRKTGDVDGERATLTTLLARRTHRFGDASPEVARTRQTLAELRGESSARR